MRWPPLIFDLAVVIALWAAVLWTLRRRRRHLVVVADDRAMRSYRLQASGTVCTAVGVTWFVAWLITDTTGPHWLHTLSMPAALIFIAVGAVLSGYAGWVGRP